MIGPDPSDTGALLAALLQGPDEPQRDRLRDHLIARFAPDALIGPLIDRLGDLDGPGAPDVLRLVEWVQAPKLWEALAETLRRDAAMAPDVAWLALRALEEAGRLNDDDLAARLLEFEDLAGSDPIADLAEQLDEDPEQVWVPLQALARIEPHVRAGIVEELARRPMGPGLVEFLRLLAHAHDPLTREAALTALVVQPSSQDEVARAWLSIAADHSDPEVVARARRWLGARMGVADTSGLARRRAPALRECLVTAVDGRGRGDVLLAAERLGRVTVAAFQCDVLAGVVGVTGEVLADIDAAHEFLAEYATGPERDVVEGRFDLGLALLAGCLGISGADAPPSLRFWLEETVGPDFAPRPFAGDSEDSDREGVSNEELRAWSESIVETCRDWIDDSPLTRELAQAIRLREPGARPNPIRDAGAYRFLFERRLRDRLELYRRMLFWMAAFWRAAGQDDLGRAALTIAWQLTDPAQVVPGHPFTVALTTRSLEVG